jgi:uncharacterized membrane protein YoaK (UPF0700 family)
MTLRERRSAFKNSTSGWPTTHPKLTCSVEGLSHSYALLNFGVYASFMSGNTTSAGSHIGQSNLAAAEHGLFPIPFFVLGTFVGTLLIRPEPHYRLARLSLLVATMLTVGVPASYFALPGWAGILVLGTAMGVAVARPHVSGFRYVGSPGDFRRLR